MLEASTQAGELHHEPTKFEEAKRQNGKTAKEKTLLSYHLAIFPSCPLAIFIMAKITPSALISEIKGKMGGNTIQMWKGEIILRGLFNPRQAYSESQTKLRGLASDYAGAYDGLSSTQKAEWDAYADALTDVMTGMDAYVRNNVRLIYADHVSLTAITNPPDPPAPPTAPASFAVSFDAGDNEFDLTWTTPNSASLWVQAFYSPQVGYNNSLFPAWKFDSTVVSSAQVIHVSAVRYASPRILRFRIRVIDDCGETSAWSSTISDDK